MYCSRCSRKVLPIICFDIDGVLGDYHAHFHRFAAWYVARDGNQAHALLQSLNDYDGSEPHGEWFENHGISRQTFRTIKLAYRQGAQKRTMPTIGSNISVVRKVGEMGVEVWLTTTRPYLRLDNVDPDTRWWLEKMEVPFDYMLYDDVKYQELARRVDRQRVIAIIDDDHEQYDDAEALFGREVPILFKTGWNEAVERHNEAEHGAMLKQMLVERIEQYGRYYG